MPRDLFEEMKGRDLFAGMPEPPLSAGAGKEQIDFAKEVDFARSAIAAGKPSDAIKTAFKERTGKNLPDTPAEAISFMSNIPPLTPLQELGSEVRTPEQEKEAAAEMTRLIWPGWEQAKRDVIKGVTPALGALGATVGTLLAPGPWGTALGFTVGSRGGRGIESLTGVSPPETLEESIKGGVTETALGLLPYGIEKTVGAISKIPGIIKTPWTKARKVERVFTKTGGKLEKPLAGESGLAGAKRTYETIHTEGDRLYESAKKLVPAETKVQGNNLYSAIDDVLKDPAATDAEKAFAREILGRISPAARSGTRGRMGLSAQNLEDIMGRAEETGQLGIMTRLATMEEAYTTRSILSKATTKEGPVGWRAGQMLDAHLQDISEAAGKVGIPEITKAFSKAIYFWRSKVVPQRTMVDVLGKKSPELLPDLLLQDVNMVKALKKAMPESNFQNMKRGLLTDIATKENNNPIAIAKKLRTLLSDNKYVMQEAFNAEEIEAIKLAGDPRALGKYFEMHPRVKWLARFLGYSAMYGTVGAGGALGLKRLFGW